MTHQFSGDETGHEATRFAALPASKRGRAAALHEADSARWGRGVVLLLLLLLTAAAVTGCGYTQRELFPEEHRTVAVPIFENRTSYRHVETDLSEALVKQIERRTPYKVVAPATADTILEGTVRAVEQTQLSRRSEGGVPEEMEVQVVVDFQWKDLETGRVLRSRSGFEATGRYVVARPVGEPLENAQHTAAQRLAEDMVSVMRVGVGE